MVKYPKIDIPFLRDETDSGKITDVFKEEIVGYLADKQWIGTEKIDGTNTGVVWDGYRVSFQGRTENTDMPKHLVEELERLFGGEDKEGVFEELFGEQEVILFGEGYGKKLQKSGNLYNPNKACFILFDVYLPQKDIWLKRDALEDIAKRFNIDVVPIVFKGTLNEAIEYIRTKPKSTIGNADMEGIVCTPPMEIRNRLGNRIRVKIKVHDFK